MLAVLHDLTLAAAVCDRLVVMADGVVVASGQPRDVVTRELLRNVYGVAAEVEPSPATGRPVVVVASPETAVPALDVRMLVVGGAGRGAPLFRMLAERGVQVSAGVLHGMDTDEDVATRMDLTRVSVPPFSAIDDDAASTWRELAAAADVIDRLRRSRRTRQPSQPGAGARGGPRRSRDRAGRPGADRGTGFHPGTGDGAVGGAPGGRPLGTRQRPSGRRRARPRLTAQRPSNGPSSPDSRVRSDRNRSISDASSSPDVSRSSPARASSRWRYAPASSSAATAASRRSRCSCASAMSVPSGSSTPRCRPRCSRSAIDAIANGPPT